MDLRSLSGVFTDNSAVFKGVENSWWQTIDILTRSLCLVQVFSLDVATDEECTESVEKQQDSSEIHAWEQFTLIYTYISMRNMWFLSGGTTRPFGKDPHPNQETKKLMNV